MPKKRSDNRDKAKELYILSDGKIALAEISRKLKVPTGTVRGWKKRDEWDVALNETIETDMERLKSQNNPLQEIRDCEILESSELNERQSIFCINYVKSFNATQAAIKAGYSKDSAHVIGSRLLRNVKVKEEIDKLKENVTEGSLIQAKDLLNKHLAIAFSDITDYVSFGEREVQLIGEDGPMVDDKGNPITRTISYVDLKNDYEVDGSLISEISQGRDGVRLKLIDKSKSLEFLSKNYGLLDQATKIRLEIERQKLELMKQKHEKEPEDTDINIVISYGDEMVGDEPEEGEVGGKTEKR